MRYPFMFEVHRYFRCQNPCSRLHAQLIYSDVASACLTVLSIYVPNGFNLIFVVIFKYCSLNLLRIFFLVLCYSLSAAMHANIEHQTLAWKDGKQARNIFRTRKYLCILECSLFIIMMRGFV